MPGGHFITRIREGLSLTQPRFAEILGVHAMTVSRWERGELVPSDYQMALIEQFGRAARVRATRETVKKVLVTGGAIMALLALLNAAQSNRRR